MSGDLAAWLRGQREARGWSRLEVARQLIGASEATDRPVTSPARTLEYSVGRWERGLLVPGERYRLLYCAAFGIARALFGGEQGRLRAPDQRPLSRFRDIRNTDLDRVRPAVEAWREAHPDGSEEQMLAALLPDFPDGYRLALAGMLFVVDKRRARQVAELSPARATSGE